MFIPINIKTEYDLMNSLIKIEDLISYALNNGINTLGISDTNMFGAYEFISLCNKNNIKPLVGSELLIDNNHITLYAINYEGYKSLCNIVSKKNIDGIDINYIKENSNNLICICDKDNYSIFSSIFEYVFIGYTNTNEREEYLKITPNIIYNPKICYFEESDKEYFKYIKYIESGKTLEEENIEISDFHFPKNVSSIDSKNTNKFASLINIEFPSKTIHMPKYNEDSTKFLRALAKKGLEKRLNNNVSEKYINRLMMELSIIEKMNYVDYFLIVYDFVLFAKKNNIMVGAGRGSGVASLVNYSLGIIDIDPLEYDLIFERFLNPDRITMPDIDIDFDDEKREIVIDYVISKYGINNTARIISFNTLAPKQVIRDISRVLNIDSNLVDKICKTIKGNEKNFEELKSNYEFTYMISKSNTLKELIRICNKLCGLKKNTSITAAGVVISDTPLVNIMPLYKSNNTILTGYSKEYIEDLGLLKMDFLSLKNLSTLSSILEDMKSNGIDLDINKIPLNDTKTLNLFKNAYTTGIFQFESSGMRSFLKALNLSDFNTLVDALALYRPGPRDMIDEYILRKNNKKKITYEVKELESILSSTYGIIIYQEQVLEILKRVIGYTYAEADNVRRAMSKKKISIIEENKTRIISKVISLGYSEEVANNLFNNIVKFAGYGFNKSHSVAYSNLSYKIAYLKANYPYYFMKNLLNNSKNSPMIKEYIDESKLLGIKFKNISINYSYSDFVSKNDELVLPFTLIKSISTNISNSIIEERNKESFKDFYDFMIRCYKGNINKKVVISLIECGVFDEFNINKKMIINNIDEVINYVNLCSELSLIVEEKPIFDEVEDFSDRECIDNEIKNYGFYLSFHPVTKYDRSNYMKLDNYRSFFNRVVSTILFVENVKTIKTKNNEKMSFVTFSDEYGSIEGIIFPDLYKKIGELEKNEVYIISGKIEKRNSEYQLIVYGVKR